MARRDNETARKHTAAEWTRLVRAWKRSGLSATKFAASVPVAPRTLIWWRWRLAQQQGQRPGAADQVRLVPLELEGPTAPPHDGPWWEISTAAGAALRVHRQLPADEARSLVEAFFAAAVKP